MTKIIRWLLIFFVGFLVLTGGLIYFLYQSTPERLNILVVGSDQRGEERARSDVLMVLSIPKSSQKSVSLLTIPRDTRVEIPDHGTQKITHAYALGDREEGTLLGNIDLTRDTVEKLIGLQQQATVEVTFDSFVEIVDMMGGVDISSGHLNGEEALAIVRDRYRSGGDFARTEDQREVLLSLMKKIRSEQMATMAYNYFLNNPESRLQFGRLEVGMFGLFWFLGHGGRLDVGPVEEYVVPGSGQNIYTAEFGKELYYWVADEEALDDLISKNFE